MMHGASKASKKNRVRETKKSTEHDSRFCSSSESWHLLLRSGGSPAFWLAQDLRKKSEIDVLAALLSFTPETARTNEIAVQMPTVE